MNLNLQLENQALKQSLEIGMLSYDESQSVYIPHFSIEDGSSQNDKTLLEE